MDAEHYFITPLADELIKEEGLEFIFEGGGTLKVHDHANGYVTNALNIGLIQTTVYSGDMVFGDNDSQIIFSNGGNDIVHGGGSVDWFVMFYDQNHSDADYSLTLMDYEESEFVSVFEFGIVDESQLQTRHVVDESGDAFTVVSILTDLYQDDTFIRLDGTLGIFCNRFSCRIRAE